MELLTTMQLTVNHQNSPHLKLRCSYHKPVTGFTGKHGGGSVQTLTVVMKSIMTDEKYKLIMAVNWKVKYIVM